MSSEREDLAHTMTAPPRDAPVPAAAPPPGESLGRYRLERELGAGAMGVVYAAFDPDLERRVAMKVLRGATASAEAKDRLMREARAMARLAHPNVVTVHEVGTAAGRDFVAMELISGETLADWLRATRHRPAAILEAFVAAGRGLAAAHAAGIVHRDFKPHNVLRSRDGRIVVTDFGLAREAQGAIAAAAAARPAPPPPAAASPALDETLPVGSPSASGAETASASASGSATSSRSASSSLFGGSSPSASGAATASAFGGTASSRPSSSSPLVGLTVTGSLLGTPAYMAPEQWQGGTVTPATDQFAYCVALWEALAGARPYPGPSFDDLRTQVARGPAALDASRIPRRYRGLLRRGLDPDPARRWPSMDALLDQLIRARRRNHLVLAGRVAVAAAAILLGVFKLQRDPPMVARCEPPAHALASVWSPALRDQLRSAASDAHVAAIDTAVWNWRAARDTACRAAPQVRQPQLQCLDGVLARIDTLRQAFARGREVGQVPAEELSAQLVDPAICRRADATEVPRLTVAPTGDAVAAYALYLRSHAERPPGDEATDAKAEDQLEAEITTALEDAKTSACSRLIATLAFHQSHADVQRKRVAMAEAGTIADQCGDERLRAEFSIAAIVYQLELPLVGPRGDAAIRRAQAAVARVAQPDVEAALAAEKVFVARQRGHWDEAFQLARTQRDGNLARGLQRRALSGVLTLGDLRNARSEPGDLAAILEDVHAWLPLARRISPEHARALEVLDALVRYTRGDIAAAHADLLRLLARQPHEPAPGGTLPITGLVVDVHGQPVAGASVAVASNLEIDAIGAVPMFGSEGLRDGLQLTTSDAAGRFRFDHITAGAAARGGIAAQLGDRRSPALPITDGVRLALEPTRTISGRVELGGAAATRAIVLARPEATLDREAFEIATVAADGSFTLGGASVRALRIGAAVSSGQSEQSNIELQPVRAGMGPIAGLVLQTARSNRSLDVVVRSAVTAPLDAALVIIVPGRHAITRGADLLRIAAGGVQSQAARPGAISDAEPATRARMQRGDLLAHTEHVTLGVLTVCAIALGADMLDPQAQRQMVAHLAQFEVRCKPAAPDTAIVELEVPPQQRFQ